MGERLNSAVSKAKELFEAIVKLEAGKEDEEWADVRCLVAGFSDQGVRPAKRLRLEACELHENEETASHNFRFFLLKLFNKFASLDKVAEVLQTLDQHNSLDREAFSASEQLAASRRALSSQSLIDMIKAAHEAKGRDTIDFKHLAEKMEAELIATRAKVAAAHEKRRAMQGEIQAAVEDALPATQVEKE